MIKAFLYSLLLSFLPLSAAAGDELACYQESTYGGIIADISTGQNTQPRLYNSKELDRTNNLFWYDFLARPYDPTRGQFTGPDQKAEEYYPWNQYTFCGNNPMKYTDPSGKIWEDINGNVISDHSNIKVYIFYDPNSFSKQSFAMYKSAVKKYGEGSVALSKVTTEKEFASDWGAMGGNDIREVNLNYHGSNQALHLDYKKKQYVTATGNGYINSQTQSDKIEALNVQDLPIPVGDISHAQLNINSCKSNSTSQKPLLGNGKTLMRTFADTFYFQTVRGTSVGVSYDRFLLTPHPKYLSSEGWFKNWEYIGIPTGSHILRKTKMVDFLYYKTGGMK